MSGSAIISGMPSRNVLKIDVSDNYYHIYARGHSRNKIFKDDQDCDYFIKLFKRYLSKEPQLSKLGVPYIHLHNKVELLAYCIMENHFHLLIYQKEQGAMSLLMRGVLVSYSHYSNHKNQTSGSLFESRYKASMIDKQNYLDHVSRYIHLNRKPWKGSKYSSIDYYLTNKTADWINTKRVLDMFEGKDDYAEFVADYEDSQKILDELKYELANTIIP